MMPNPDLETARTWHLATDSHDAAVTDFEFALMQVYEAFQRYCVSLGRLVGQPEITFNEVVVLHVVRMQERPKDAGTIAKLVNRDDLPNVLYNLRKLVSLGLVTKTRNGSATLFEVTERGRIETQRYADLRNRVLLEAFARTPNIEERMQEVDWTLNLLTGLYDSAARDVASINPSALFADEAADAPAPRSTKGARAKK